MAIPAKRPSSAESQATKLRSIQVPQYGPLSTISTTLEELKKDLPDGPESRPDSTRRPAGKVTPVEIVNGNDQRIEFMQVVLAPVLGPLGTAALVVVLLDAAGGIAEPDHPTDWSAWLVRTERGGNDAVG
jgi:hypothetical protein